jgi:hypothetical protein
MTLSIGGEEMAEQEIYGDMVQMGQSKVCWCIVAFWRVAKAQVHYFVPWDLCLSVPTVSPFSFVQKQLVLSL